jgi:outer membrane protein TolC
LGNEWISTFSPNNYKWGIDFSFPVFLRKERGDLQLANIKMMEIDYSKEQKILEISNKIDQYKNELNITQQQNVLFNQLVANYEGLWKAEKRNFEAGESSLFLVNAREMAYIDSQLKQLELQAKLNKCKAAVLWSMGQLK